MLIKIELETTIREGLINITPQVMEAVQKSGVKEGMCLIFIPHTTAAITINSALDPNTASDITQDIKRLVPTRVDFQHTYDTPADAAGHIKSTLIGCSQTLIISQGKLLLGSSQSLLFYEFDGPRKRSVILRIMADTN